MFSPDPSPGIVGFTAFGVSASVRADHPQVFELARGLLPPGWAPGPAEPEEGAFAIGVQDERFEVTRDGATRVNTLDLDLALQILDSELRAHVALRAPERIFVHAGAVGVGERAILIPGASLSGKTTLVAALLRAGATYYSDEFAVLDAEGRVHAYPKPLSIRESGEHSAESLGAAIGAAPVPVGVIAVTEYKPRATWSPERGSAADGAMALLAHTVPARDRPREALAAVSRAAREATVLQGERGDADETAAALLALA